MEPKLWKGTTSIELKTCKAQHVWPLFEDFFGLDKWFPSITTCLPIEGKSGQPGCVRFCSGFKTVNDSNDNTTGSVKQRVNWTKQKLLSIDPTEKVFTYSIVEGNVGFNGYLSTVKVVPAGEGCRIEWDYEVEPVEGWKPQDLDDFIGTGLQVMANRMEAALGAYLELTKS